MGRGRGRGRGPKKGQEHGRGHLQEQEVHGSRPGPCSLNEILNFPDMVFTRLLEGEHGSERRARLQALVANGLCLHTQYSGKGTAETCLAHLRQALLDAGVLAESVPWYTASAFDSKDFACKVLQSHSPESRPRCIFGAMEECLSPEVRTELDRMCPAKSQSAVQRQHAYDAMNELLKNDLARAFPAQHTAACRMHPGKLHGCAVWPEPSSKGELCMFVAGQTCKDVSRRGSRQGFAGPNTRSYVVWLGMVRHRQPDMFLHEITCSSEAAERLEKDLGDLYDILTCACVSPHHLGVPVQRQRQYSVGVLRGKLVHLGSWEEFFQVMGSRCELTGAVFYAASAEHRCEVSQHMAKKQGWYHKPGQQPSLQEQLTPAEFRRFAEYQKVAGERGLGPGEFFCADVDQEVGFGDVSVLAPCLLSHGKIVHGREEFVATSLEHLLMMGAPAKVAVCLPLVAAPTMVPSECSTLQILGCRP